MPPRDNTPPRRGSSQVAPGKAVLTDPTGPLADPTLAPVVSVPPPRRMSATPLKKKATSKGLFKLKPKRGCRTLSQQLKDYTTIAIILLLTAWFGRYLQARKLAEEEVEAHGEALEDAHRSLEAVGGVLTDARRELHGHHHHFDPVLDMQATLGICIVLITVTILFEAVKHKLEHDVPPMMASVLQAMFGELTVLGFIALYAYFMLRLGVLAMISTLIYGDD